MRGVSCIRTPWATLSLPLVSVSHLHCLNIGELLSCPVVLRLALATAVGALLWWAASTGSPEGPHTPSVAEGSPEALLLLPTIPLPPVAHLVATATPERRPTITPGRAIPRSPKPLSKQATADGIYLRVAEKHGLTYKYSCEFDAAWMILRSYDLRTSVDDLIAQLPRDETVEPYLVEGREGFRIVGGDITAVYSGDVRRNYLARTTGAAMAQLFHQYGLKTKAVHSQEALMAALDQGAPVWIKATVDFAVGRPALWVMPSGAIRPTVLGNDHAVVVVGYTAEGAIIKDPLGPSASNLDRPYEYAVGWERFLRVWAQQQHDGLAVFAQETTVRP